MPRAVAPPPSPRLDLDKLRLRMDAATQKEVARRLGLQALDHAVVQKIESAVLLCRAIENNPATPGTSIAAIEDALSPKLQKMFTRAMKQFTDGKSGVDVMTSIVLSPYADACLRALEAFAMAALWQKNRLVSVKHMDMNKERRKFFCGSLRVVFEEHAAPSHRVGPEGVVRRHQREFVTCVAESAGIDLKVDVGAHPERLDAMIAAKP